MPQPRLLTEPNGQDRIYARSRTTARFTWANMAEHLPPTASFDRFGATQPKLHVRVAAALIETLHLPLPLGLALAFRLAGARPGSASRKSLCRPGFRGGPPGDVRSDLTSFLRS